MNHRGTEEGMIKMMCIVKYNLRASVPLWLPLVGAE